MGKSEGTPKATFFLGLWPEEQWPFQILAYQGVTPLRAMVINSELSLNASSEVLQQTLPADG